MYLVNTTFTNGEFESIGLYWPFSNTYDLYVETTYDHNVQSVHLLLVTGHTEDGRELCKLIHSWSLQDDNSNRSMVSENGRN